jgi:hypothetical protein
MSDFAEGRARVGATATIRRSSAPLLDNGHHKRACVAHANLTVSVASKSR